MCEGFLHHIYRSKTAAEKGKKVSLVMCAHPYDNNLPPLLLRLTLLPDKIQAENGACQPHIILEPA